MQRGSCAAKYRRKPISKGPKEPLFPPILNGHNLDTGGRGSWRGGQVKSPQHPLLSASLCSLGWGAELERPAPAPLLSRAQQLTDGSLISPSLIFPRLSTPGKPVFSGPIRLENFRNIVRKAVPHCLVGVIQLCPFEQISYFFSFLKKITTLRRFHFRPFRSFSSPSPNLFFFPAGKSCQTTASHPQHPLLPCSSPPTPAPPPSFFSAAVEDPQGKPSGPSTLPTLPLDRPPRAAGKPFPFLGP